jgi:hypothetical protein
LCSINSDGSSGSSSGSSSSSGGNRDGNAGPQELLLSIPSTARGTASHQRRLRVLDPVLLLGTLYSARYHQHHR